jgi:RNA polymerase sigma factor (sigma-70 family)
MEPFMTDHDLLLHYTRTGSQDAFAQLLHRHLDWVYSACRRQVKNSTLAEDVTQAVFLALARKAPSLSPSVSISGWLFTTARYASATALKIENRRLLHERQAATMKPETLPPPSWQLIEPRLDAALASLPAADRQAVLLRYFQNLSHQAIATTLNISEGAAQKRVTRALDRLRKKLASPSLAALSAPELHSLLSSHAVQPAPSALHTQSLTARSARSSHIHAIFKGTLAMKKARLAKLSISLFGASLLAVTVAAAAHFASNSPAHSPPGPLAPIAAAPQTTIGNYDLSSVRTFQVSTSSGSLSWTATYSPDSILIRRSAPGWASTTLTRGNAEWSSRDNGTLILQKIPLHDSAAQFKKIATDLTSLQNAPATRQPSQDTTVNHARCIAFHLQDAPGQSKNTTVLIDSATARPARIISEEPALDLTITYDPPLPPGFFNAPIPTPGVRIVRAADYFDEKYPLKNALITRQDIGQVFAVHEAHLDGDGLILLLCSSRPAPDLRKGSLTTTPDDLPLGKFKLDDQAHLPYQFLRLAEVQESGFQISYFLIKPLPGAPAGRCILPLTMASSDTLLQLPGVPIGDNQGRDIHDFIEVPTPPATAPAPLTPADFLSRAYDDITPLVGITPQTFLIGPRTDPGLASKKTILEDFARQLQSLTAQPLP